MRFSLAALLFVSAALAAQRKLDTNALESWVRHLFLWGPEITVSVGDPAPAEVPGFFEVRVMASAGNARQEETLLVSLDGRRIIRGTVYDVARNPFAGDLAKITTDAAPRFGPADAPVRLIIFSDLQCSYCARAAKVLREEVMPAHPQDLQVVFKDMPLDAIHPWARPAAILGRCIMRQKPAAFWQYHDWVFGAQGEITPENLRPKAAEFAGAQNLDADELARCAESPEVAAEVQRSVAEAMAVGVTSTPTMFVNGRRVVGSVPADQFHKIIQHERDYARKQPK